eukprot:scaffold10073_cov136-Isochrysis_galbana.AAC.8
MRRHGRSWRCVQRGGLGSYTGSALVKSLTSSGVVLTILPASTRAPAVPFLPKLITRSATRLNSFARASVVLMRSCSMSDCTRLRIMAHRWARPRPNLDCRQITPRACCSRDGCNRSAWACGGRPAIRTALDARERSAAHIAGRRRFLLPPRSKFVTCPPFVGELFARLPPSNLRFAAPQWSLALPPSLSRSSAALRPSASAPRRCARPRAPAPSRWPRSRSATSPRLTLRASASSSAAT